MKTLLNILVLSLAVSSFGQDSTQVTHRIGFTCSYDGAFNFPDEVLKTGMARKCALGMSYTNKKRQFIFFAGAGAKTFKVNLYTARFRPEFIAGIAENYSPISGNSVDSIIGVTMKNDPGKDLWGTYSQYIKVGMMLNIKFRPMVEFYYGKEQLVLYGPFDLYTSPEYLEKVHMNTTFYEVKTGFAIPFRNYRAKNFSVTLNAGYKWVNYGAFKFYNTELRDYTNDAFAQKYQHTGKLTLSAGFIYWTNW